MRSHRGVFSVRPNFGSAAPKNGRPTGRSDRERVEVALNTLDLQPTFVGRDETTRGARSELTPMATRWGDSYGSVPPPTPLLRGDDGRRRRNWDDWDARDRYKDDGPSVGCVTLFGVLFFVALAGVGIVASGGHHGAWDSPPRARNTDDHRPPRQVPDLGACKPQCDYVNDAAPRSLIIYNTTWRAGLADRQDMYGGILAQLAALTCARIAIMPPTLALDAGHNDGYFMPDTWRWDTYFANRSLVPYAPKQDDDAYYDYAYDDAEDVYPRGDTYEPILMDWKNDGAQITRDYFDRYNNPNVKIFGDEPDRLTDAKIRRNLRSAIECARKGVPFIWKMNFEVTWGARYDWWVREFVGKDKAKAGRMYAAEMSMMEKELRRLKALDKHVGLRDCTLAEVTPSHVISRLADEATASALSSSGLGRDTDAGTTDEIIDSFDSSSGVKFMALHARRGDELAWCDTSPDALDAFVRCALANATNSDVRAGKVPLLWFTDERDETYVKESTAAMRAAMLKHIREQKNDEGSDRYFPGVVYGEKLVNQTVNEMLVRVADEIGIDVGGVGKDRAHAGDNYLRYQIGVEMMSRASADADAYWNIHFSYREGKSFKHGTCGGHRGHVCAQDGPVLRMARGEEGALKEFEDLLDVGNNAFLVGGVKLAKERETKRAKATADGDSTGADGDTEEDVADSKRDDDDR